VVMMLVVVLPACVGGVDVNNLFSSISLALRAFRLAFSDKMRAFSSSSSFILISISSIRTRFLSLAFCAATLFFSLRRISFSSGVKWSKLARFRLGWSHSSSARLATVMGEEGLLVALMVGSTTLVVALGVEVAAAAAEVAAGLEASLKMVCSPLTAFELRRRLLGNTIICWLDCVVMVELFCCKGEGLTTNFLTVVAVVAGWLGLFVVANSTIIVLVCLNNHG